MKIIIVEVNNRIFKADFNHLRFRANLTVLTAKPLILDQSLHEILKELEVSTDSYFITGKAGTGKSTLLQIFRDTTRKNVVVLAPTGVAALNVRGQTIHSFFGFPPHLIDKQTIEKRKNHRFYARIDTIIIDEISMVRADILDHINYFLQINRQDSRHFGGVQMILFGDVFQLPPVVATPFERDYFRTVYASPYFFDAHIMQGGFKYFTIHLQKIYRQNEKHFIQILDAIRNKQLDNHTLDVLNQRVAANPLKEQLMITLATRNDKVNLINLQELQKLDTPTMGYPAEINGLFEPQFYPTDLVLKLKVGAQIMLLKNDLQKRYVNGTLGRVEILKEQEIAISVIAEDGKKVFIELEKNTWELMKYRMNSQEGNRIESEVIGTFTQYPIRLAWAITIHKSQGKTFDYINVDLDKGAFEHGQTYVALSRCRTLDGVFLQRPIQDRDILVDERVIEFYDQCTR